MDQSAEELIDKLRERVGAESDAELARKLGIDKSTVSSWRTRNSVPKRYRLILEGTSTSGIGTPPLVWGDHEKAAFELALFRYSRVASEAGGLKDYKNAMAFFTRSSPRFWFLMQQAQRDIVQRQDTGEYPVKTAVALLLLNDFENSEAALERDSAIVSRVQVSHD